MQAARTDRPMDPHHLPVRPIDQVGIVDGERTRIAGQFHHAYSCRTMSTTAAGSLPANSQFRGEMGWPST